MDFTNRSSQPQTVAPNSPSGSNPAQPSPISGKHGHKDGSNWRRPNQWGRGGIAVFLLCVLVLAVAVIGLIAFSNDQEGQYVKKDKYQAVFLNNNQVYFGHVQNVTSKYLTLTNIYYIQPTQKSATDKTATGYSLTKLGCELHAPYDQMIIQLDQVSFWENIQSSGQVAQGIAKLPKCTPTTPPANQNNATTPSSSSNNSNSSNNSSSSNASGSSDQNQPNSSSSAPSSTSTSTPPTKTNTTTPTAPKP